MRLLELGTKPSAPAELGPVNVRRIGTALLLTSVFGAWAFVTEAELAALMRGELEPGGALWTKLAAAGLVASKLDVAEAVAGFWQRRGFIEHGPSRHVVRLTRRGACPRAFGEPGPDEARPDMSHETAERVVELALRSTSPEVTLELRGGEPLACLPLVRHLCDYALDKNRAFGKALEIALVSPLSHDPVAARAGAAGGTPAGWLDDAALDYLIDKRVRLVVRIDAGAFVTDAGAALVPQPLAAAIARVHERYRALGLERATYHVEADVVVPERALAAAGALTAGLEALGCGSFALRPEAEWIERAGRSAGARLRAATRFLAFYREVMDAVVARAAAGEALVERRVAAFAARVLGRDAPRDGLVRSPAASATGELAYDTDGRVFTSDVGLALAAAGDELFLLGEVASARYRALMTHDTVRALVLASIREAQPDCAACAYAPFCGIEPEASYAASGSIFGRMRESFECALHKGLQDWLFAALARDDAALRALFERWSKPQAQSHFVHSGVAS